MALFQVCPLVPELEISLRRCEQSRTQEIGMPAVRSSSSSGGRRSEKRTLENQSSLKPAVRSCRQFAQALLQAGAGPENARWRAQILQVGHATPLRRPMRLAPAALRTSPASRCVAPAFSANIACMHHRVRGSCGRHGGKVPGVRVGSGIARSAEGCARAQAPSMGGPDAPDRAPLPAHPSPAPGSPFPTLVHAPLIAGGGCRGPDASATRRYGAAPCAHTIDSAAILFFGVVKTTL